jgi:hypothetical protein
LRRSAERTGTRLAALSQMNVGLGPGAAIFFAAG